VFAWYGALNGITLATVKALSPGVPDFYQGHLAIELSLVDPDNRRAVAFDHRHALLAQAKEVAAAPDRRAALREMLDHAPDGRAKFWATWRALQLRRAHEAMLRAADYTPLDVRGKRAQHVIAFARSDGSQWVVVVAARLFASLGLRVGEAPVGPVWGDTRIVCPEGLRARLAQPGCQLECAVSGQRRAAEEDTLSVAQLLGSFPVAALQVVGGDVR